MNALPGTPVGFKTPRMSGMLQYDIEELLKTPEKTSICNTRDIYRVGEYLPIYLVKGPMEKTGAMIHRGTCSHDDDTYSIIHLLDFTTLSAESDKKIIALATKSVTDTVEETRHAASQAAE